MRVLSLDTSSRFGVIGVCEDGESIAQATLRSNESHSARLLPSIAWLLETSNLRIEDIDAFGVVTGPGSFTGLRVGIATVKGLAWAHKKPVAALHALEVLVNPFQFESRPIAAMMDAKRGFVYGAVYRWNQQNLIPIVKPEYIEPSVLLSEVSGDILCVGDGCRKYGKELGNVKHANAIPVDCTFDVSSGAILAKMAYDSIINNHVVDLMNMEPLYLRVSEFESKESVVKHVEA